ncbi:hypothetical protein GCM10008986_05620 [Salinibacillus aidingensis]|uniref:Uncharacterized protein n=1 Tax=Salinibacillus aidingensis TaxID=237684 RepID=A0ABP3KNC2_9BACI
MTKSVANKDGDEWMKKTSQTRLVYHKKRLQPHYEDEVFLKVCIMLLVQQGTHLLFYGHVRNARI